LGVDYFADLDFQISRRVVMKANAMSDNLLVMTGAGIGVDFYCFSLKASVSDEVRVAAGGNHEMGYCDPSGTWRPWTSNKVPTGVDLKAEGNLWPGKHDAYDQDETVFVKALLAQIGRNCGKIRSGLAIAGRRTTWQKQGAVLYSTKAIVYAKVFRPKVIVKRCVLSSSGGR
jgi:hypothetical protein